MQKLTNEELKRLSVEEFKESEKLPVYIILDNVRSGLNVGSVFRSADAFRVAGIYCCGITPVPPHREVLKSALGATDSVQWEYFQDTLSVISKLRSGGCIIASVEQTSNAVMLHQIPKSAQPLAIIFGHEMDGVSQEAINQSDYSIEIPQTGTKHSLNISVCAGIVLWELARQHLPVASTL